MTNRSGECAVVIMAKAPSAGAVKTRLCPPLSPEGAARLYRYFLMDKIEQVSALQGVVPAIAYTPDDARKLFEAMAPSRFAFVPQQGADLGERLADALNRFLDLGCAEAMAVDSDTPNLPVHYLEKALSLLCDPDVDLVLGPSDDGGYYLIGLRRVYRELFERMSWSTAQVFAETVRRARAKGLKVACLPAWYDVDTPEDLKRLRDSLGSASTPEGRHTKRFLLESVE